MEYKDVGKTSSRLSHAALRISCFSLICREIGSDAGKDAGGGVPTVCGDDRHRQMGQANQSCV